jgi:hypothetical protein
MRLFVDLGSLQRMTTQIFENRFGHGHPAIMSHSTTGAGWARPFIANFTISRQSRRCPRITKSDLMGKVEM